MIVVKAFGAGIVRIGIGPEAARIDLAMLISASPWIIHCARYLPQPAPCAMPMDDPQHCQAVRHARHRADQRVAVGRVRDGPVDDALDARIGKDRHPLQRLFQPGRDAVEIALEQLILA